MIIFYEAFYIKTIWPSIDTVIMEEGTMASTEGMYCNRSNYTIEPIIYIDKKTLLLHLKQEDEE